MLVGQRNRLRASERPRRLFEDARAVAEEAGLLGGRARVLDSTPIYDAVATQDTVTHLRSAIRKLLRVLALRTPALAAKVRSALARDDDYATPGKPPCDWDDREARGARIDALGRDARAAPAAVEGEKLQGAAKDAADLLALVAGQDVEEGDDGQFRIARRVARDRVISTVDPEARHGHKSRNRRFDGYKAHVSVDPDSELIDEVVLTPANTHDADAVDGLLGGHADDEDKPTVFADSAYAGAGTLSRLHDAGYDVRAKVPPASNRGGRFSKDDFTLDLEHNTAMCPAGHVVAIRFGSDRGGRADFGEHCAGCPLRERCTTAATGRTITIHPREAVLQRAKAEQAGLEWKQAYRGTRPKVERKIAHFVRAVWGGRHARTRGLVRVATDVDTWAAAVDWPGSPPWACIAMAARGRPGRHKR